MGRFRLKPQPPDAAARGTRTHFRHRWRIRAGRACWRKVAGFDRPAQVLQYPRKVEPLQFEEALLSAFEGCGARIQHNARYSGDGGIDGNLHPQPFLETMELVTKASQAVRKVSGVLRRPTMAGKGQ